MSSMGSFGGQTKWRGAGGEERRVNSLSNGVLICGGNLQRAAPGCVSWHDETEVTAWQLLLVVSLIRQQQPQSWRKDDGFGGSSPAKTWRLSRASQGGAQCVHEGGKKGKIWEVWNWYSGHSCKPGGVLAIVQVGFGSVWQKLSISNYDMAQMKKFILLSWSTDNLYHMRIWEY